MGARQLQAYQRLVDDAVAKGARLLAGGYVPEAGSELAKVRGGGRARVVG
jgi:acyl-CoA reductase-like NAD-dependent aldehyde dehydrogenase